MKVIFRIVARIFMAASALSKAICDLPAQQAQRRNKAKTITDGAEDKPVDAMARRMEILRWQLDCITTAIHKQQVERANAVAAADVMVAKMVQDLNRADHTIWQLQAEAQQLRQANHAAQQAMVQLREQVYRAPAPATAGNGWGALGDGQGGNSQGGSGAFAGRFGGLW